MPVVKLTDKFCENAKPLGTQTDYFDSVTTGLALRVSSGARTFYLHFTKPGSGKRARFKLGPYPGLSLAKAREKAKDVRGQVIDGTDPVAEKKASEAGQTVRDLVDNYIERQASKHRSTDEIARRLRKNVSDVIGDIKLASLHRRDLTRCIDKVKDRGADVEANRVFEDMRAMIRWARGRGDLDNNLMEGMKKPTKVKERDRYLTADEIKTVWTALAEADMWESTRRILRLCLITGQRVGEVAGMTRDEFSDNQRTWTIPAERSKNKRKHVVHLSDSAMRIIREQLADVRALSERKDRAVPRYVFPAPGGRNAVGAASIPKALKRLEVVKGTTSTVLGVPPWTPHDLRRTAATGMEEIGVSPFIIGHVLNHVSATKASITSKVYARYDYAKEKERALDLWAARVTGIVEGNGDVVPLRRAEG